MLARVNLHRAAPSLPGRVWRWVAALALPLLLAACATPGIEPSTGPDDSDADRRARARFELALAYFTQGQYQTALDEIRQSIAAKPSYAAAHNLRGLILSSMGSNVQAEESFRRAVQLDPRDADTLHNFGWFECQNGRYPQADQWFDRALEIPQYRGLSRTLLAKGLCQLRAEKPAEAERSLLRSYELDPSNAATAYQLADLMLRRSDLERARFYARRLVGNPGSADVQSLWLAVRIEAKARNRAAADTYGRELRRRFPQSREALAYERGQFDE
jgi:type IV pilus assembly protein PilF